MQISCEEKPTRRTARGDNFLRSLIRGDEDVSMLRLLLRIERVDASDPSSGLEVKLVRLLRRFGTVLSSSGNSPVKDLRRIFCANRLGDFGDPGYNMKAHR